MSHDHSAADHDAHAAPSHSLTKKILTAGMLLGVPVVMVLGLVSDYLVKDKGIAPASMTEEAVMSRIQKVGSLTLGSAKRELKTGEEVYKAQCITCHAAGVVGAPKFGDAAAWAPRVATGYDTLLTSVLKGKGAMAAQGGGSFSEYEIGRALVYMANAGGAKFNEPKAPADAAAATASAAK